ncbi:hypothetical protein F9817_17385 [Vibrio sp. CAIM 722]|uniref:HAD family hydrolase n=1 Tax=Vibrio eleionomae TaxID=2653505 RepID=A0A7X4LMY9_9VIBR|nr:hypothetical protein [Vibrio eleionomae]MZI94953.1 hypothetical protein [Vibrio eleionomae]
MKKKELEVLILDCDGVLINHHQGFLTNLYNLRQDLPQNSVTRRAAITAFETAYAKYIERLPELGFSAIQCFCFAEVLEHFSRETNWREMLHYSRSIGKWPDYEDAYGALHYLKKFYRVVVRCDREMEDIEFIKKRFGIEKNDILLRDMEPDQIQRFLRSIGLTDEQGLVVTNPQNAQRLSFPYIREISRAFDGSKESLVSLIVEHQRKLRISGTEYA